MRKTVLLGGKNISYTLKRFSRQKCVRFSVSREKALLVTAPKRTPLYWIEGVLVKQQEWILRAFDSFKNEPSYRQIGSYKTHKEKARSLISERLIHWNQFYNFQYGRISIRNQKTRWGSCSRKGNLNFSWKLAVLPEDLADYVIVHELCHLKEFNHSAKFWGLVAKTIPDYKKRRNELRQEGRG
jgi:predicted metal-dependent hydrolase